jgi:hypothetical protein
MDEKRMAELEAQIARDEQRFREVERLEEELFKDIDTQGFRAASTEGRYRDEKNELASSIREAKEMLAGLRTQRNSW